MNKEQRGPWVALTERYILCNFCRHSDPEDNGCWHPLEIVQDMSSNMEPTDDCWGFRSGPGDTVEAAAIRLQEWQAEDAETRRSEEWR